MMTSLTRGPLSTALDELVTTVSATIERHVCEHLAECGIRFTVELDIEAFRGGLFVSTTSGPLVIDDDQGIRILQRLLDARNSESPYARWDQSVPCNDSTVLRLIRAGVFTLGPKAHRLLMGGYSTYTNQVPFLDMLCDDARYRESAVQSSHVLLIGDGPVFSHYRSALETVGARRVSIWPPDGDRPRNANQAKAMSPSVLLSRPAEADALLAIVRDVDLIAVCASQLSRQSLRRISLACRAAQIPMFACLTYGRYSVIMPVRESGRVWCDPCLIRRSSRDALEPGPATELWTEVCGVDMDSSSTVSEPWYTSVARYGVFHIFKFLALRFRPDCFSRVQFLYTADSRKMRSRSVPVSSLYFQCDGQCK